MKKKMLELLAKKKAIIDRMKQADTASDQAAFEAAQADLAPVDAEIARVQAILDAEAAVPAEPAAQPQQPNAPPAQGAANGEPVNSRECMHAFADCIRAQARGNRQMFDASADVLRRAMAAENAGAMTEGVDADGGLLVPQDIQTRINELRRSLVPLADLFAVENVSYLSGSRVVDTAPNKGFTKIAEMDDIPQDDKPAFRKIPYKVEDYALILPVSNDLLRDTDEALLAYISRWLAKKQVITENNLLVAKLAALDTGAAAATETDVVKVLKTALNKTLDPAISATAHFVTNQDGFNALDQLVDGNSRPLLQPDPSGSTGKMLFGRGVTVVSNAVLATKTSKAPIYFGDFTQYATLFRRQPMEVASTDIGGKAWTTNSTEVRAITRLDCQVFDAAAATGVQLTLA